MLLDPVFETKSANAGSTPPPRASRRFRPRRTIADRVREALLVLADDSARVLTHEETAWASITFSGTRHEVLLDFDGLEACKAGEEFIANLPDHEFRIPGHLVADADVRAVEHRFTGDGERMLVTAVLLLLEEV
jgi:hypothetical protein